MIHTFFLLFHFDLLIIGIYHAHLSFVFKRSIQKQKWYTAQLYQFQWLDYMRDLGWTLNAWSICICLSKRTIDRSLCHQMESGNYHYISHRINILRMYDLQRSANPAWSGNHHTETDPKDFFTFTPVRSFYKPGLNIFKNTDPWRMGRRKINDNS